MTIKPSSRLILLATAGVCLLAGGVAVSQVAPLPATQWDNRRLEQLDRNVRRLERALTQRNAVGQPVIVELDPEVVTLQGQVAQMDRRLGDIEQTVRQVNGELERTTFQLDESTRANAALRTQLTAVEARLKTAEDARAAAAAAPVAGASPTGDAVADLAAARALTDPSASAAALEAVANNWNGTPSGREASWRLGDIRRAANDHASAVQLYATALNGWPTAPWAGETTLKLARALVATDRDAQACGALAEFNRRYAAAASTALKGIATQVSGQANCS